MLEAIRYSKGGLQLLDQLTLPENFQYFDVKSVEDGWDAIRTMKVRGAPAIAIAGMLSVAVDLTTRQQSDFFTSLPTFNAWLDEKLSYLKTSRPTAVNLFEAIERFRKLVDSEILLQKQNQVTDEKQLVSLAIDKFVAEASKMLADDVQSNRSMGNFGAIHTMETLQLATKKQKDKLSVLTICNTGSLATAGYGTALGVIRSLFEKGQLEMAYCCETRPYNQGSRLTALELVHDKIPATLICDSMAAYLMKKGRVDFVVIGADRITSNGDTANKIGSYSLALAAQYHSIPFFVAAPCTTIDLNMSSGDQIVVEERSPNEVKFIKNVQLAPLEINVWNPAFDVTPHNLIDGIFTDKGVATKAKKDDAFDLKSFVNNN